MDQFDALFIPGGYSPDHLRANPNMVRNLVTSRKPADIPAFVRES